MHTLYSKGLLPCAEAEGSSAATDSAELSKSENIGTRANRKPGRRPGSAWSRAAMPANPDRVWRPVDGWPYEVSSDGWVRSRRRVLKPLPRPSGYRCVILSDAPRKLMAYVHRLVADAFLAPDATRPEVNHKNGDKADNRVANLERCTKSENAIHARDVLGRQCGKRRSA